MSGGHHNSKHTHRYNYNNDSQSSSSYDKHKRSHSSTNYGSNIEYTRRKRKRSSSSSSPNDSNRKSSKFNENDTTTNEPETTNLMDFSFLDYKSILNKILLGFGPGDRLIDEPTDFWLFVNKYENLLKKCGQCILPVPPSSSATPSNSTNSNIPKKYDKSFNINFTINIPFEELMGRISSVYSDRTAKLTNLKIKQFLQIVIHYLDFKQKEKFTKIKKLKALQKNLPISKYKQEIIEAVRNEQVILIAGDTGCGKSTQIPQYLFEAGYQRIACTQPRRIACISLSKRVAHEMLCEYGTEVGYQIRFERSKSLKTKILFITEGLLLRQLSMESTLSQYDVLVLDEVHERHLHGDFLLGVTKCLLKARPDLKLILMSATINITLFSEYFAEENCRVIEVPGRLYPIKLHYMPQIQDSPMGRQSKTDRLNPEPFVQVMQLIDNKYPKTEKGDLLIFLSGLNEITTVVEAAKEYTDKSNNWIILPLHSTLSIADQDKVFDYAPDGVRKCIVSTNIAETSITIDGIRFVVDSGKVKEMSYDAVSKMQRLKEFWISKASADQRKGRAGRTGPGICYRLYSEKTFNDLEAYSTAEIHRVPLESLILQMISMGLPNARLFPFIESPPAESIENSILSLKQHDALTADEKITPIGQTLSRLPVDIAIGKMLLMGCVFQQLQPVLTMAAALSIQTPFTNRAYRDHDCEIARKNLESDHGDPITILNAYKEWLELKQAKFNHRNDHIENTKKWCKRRGLEEQRFYEITKLRKQFEDLLRDCDLLMCNDMKSGTMSGREKSLRHGELKQLRDLKRTHKNEAPKKRKLLKSDPWGLELDDIDDDAIDIRDVDFRLSHDSSKIDNLLSGATACSYRDLMTLKLILVSGLYPQIAIGDEFNYCKSPSQQFYHTQTKPFTSLHPMSYFGNNTQILQLNEPDIIEKMPPYKSKIPLSSKHQLLCYLSLLETTKPYLMNTLRMPAAQTLLLFAHSIETNSTFSRIICDQWLCIDFPQPESGQIILLKASNLRRTWNTLLMKKLESINTSVEGELRKNETQDSIFELELDLWHNLSLYMNSEIPYTIKRLLPADLKTLYVGEMQNIDLLKANPFATDFECIPNSTKGGIYITENITYNCVIETDWSIQMENDIVMADWICPNCSNTFQLNLIQRLQHKNECKPIIDEVKDSNTSKELINDQSRRRPNTTGYHCKNCDQKLYLTNFEILKHKKSCTDKL